MAIAVLTPPRSSISLSAWRNTASAGLSAGGGMSPVRPGDASAGGGSPALSGVGSAVWVSVPTGASSLGGAEAGSGGVGEGRGSGGEGRVVHTAVSAVAREQGGDPGAGRPTPPPAA